MYLKTLFILLLMCYLSNCFDEIKDLGFLYKDYLLLSTSHDYFKLHSPKTWTEAQKICETEDSILWHPKNNEEALAVFSLVNVDDWIHVGLTDTDVEGTFRTVDGIPVADVYNKWDKNQPDNAGNEDCVQMSTADGLNDIPCKEVYSFICKKIKKRLPKWIVEIRTSDPDINKIKDYLRLNTTQDYYKFHKATWWYEAKTICETEDSILWHPKNNEEAQAVISLVRANDSVLVGLTDNAVEGTFKTVDGIPITAVYNKWGTNQPDNANEEDCVLMSIDYSLNDIYCTDVIYPFICKKNKRHEQSDTTSFDDVGYNKILRNGYEYIEPLQAFYKFHITSKTWSDAKRICESEGAKFFYPKTRDEMRDVLSFCNLKKSFSCMFIGISDLIAKGSFETVDGVPLKDVYNDWQTGEPNRLNSSENCIAINEEGKLNDDSCSKNYPFVCKYPVKVPKYNYGCGIYDTDYKYNYNSKCYKMHKAALSWTDAYRVCRSEQSYLAVINSKSERDYFLYLTRDSSDQDTEVLPKETIHLGFHNKFGDGWLTINDETLDDSGFAHWDVHHPREITEGNEKRCGAMSLAGRLRDVPCDKKSFFICEHDV